MPDIGQRWYHGVTRYQWLVLAIASLGWVFDVFEGQVFVASQNKAMPALTAEGSTPEEMDLYANVAYGAFLLGGALGGIGFGILGDRIGRQKTMVYTILMYSLFTCLSALSRTWWHMALFRFLVGMGVGGEWAVASALVAEVFPRRARAWSLSIFHASSVLGTLAAVAVGAFIIRSERFGWRAGFVLGIAPALLTLWVRWSLHEPAAWVKAQETTRGATGLGRSAELFGRGLRRRTFVGAALATVGLATFWGIHIHGKDVLPRDLEMTGMLLATVGGGLGLLSFGPLSERLGRRGAFLLFHLGGFAASLAVFQMSLAVPATCALLVVFGYLTLGMHAGYAVYFPELFPTRVRSTGAGFCFNSGRILAAPVLVLTGWMRNALHLSLDNAATALSPLFLIGALVLLLAPETRGQELPE